MVSLRVWLLTSCAATDFTAVTFLAFGGHRIAARKPEGASTTDDEVLVSVVGLAGLRALVLFIWCILSTCGYKSVDVSSFRWLIALCVATVGAASALTEY